MTDALKDLIARDEWLEVAKAITFAYVNAPKNPAKYAWVSAVEEGPYHIETNDSAAKGGDTFRSLCGAAGPFNAHKLPAQIFPSQKCKACVEISTKAVTYESGTGVVANRKPLDNNNSDTQKLYENTITYRGEAVSPAAPQVLDVVPQGTTRVSGNADSIRVSGQHGLCCSADSRISEVASQGRGIAPSTESITVGNGGGCPSHSPLYLTAAEIVDQVELLRQYRDEEEAAAEEGAAIEASGYQNPAYERNGR